MGEQEQPMMGREQAESEAAPREEEVVPEGSVETGKEEPARCRCAKEEKVVTELSALRLHAPEGRRARVVRLELLVADARLAAIQLLLRFFGREEVLRKTGRREGQHE